jgi:ParB family chromosome partitioning protein
MKKKALGKGLGVFLPDDYGILKDERFAELAIDEIKPNPLQPRLKFDAKSIDELAQSIKESGVIQPIVVVPDDDQYRIIVGERRWRAALRAGLKKIPVLIRSIPRERELEISLMENLHRENLNPVEVGRVYQRMIQELGCTQEEIADRVGKDRTSVTNYLRLLSLPQAVLDILAEDKISMGHARALASLQDPEAQVTLAREIVRKNLSVREVERLITSRKETRAEARKPGFDADLHAVEEDMIRLLGSKVSIQGNRKKGTIRIFYFSLDDLNRIYTKIKGV